MWPPTRTSNYTDIGGGPISRFGAFRWHINPALGLKDIQDNPKFLLPPISNFHFHQEPLTRQVARAPPRTTPIGMTPRPDVYPMRTTATCPPTTTPKATTSSTPHGGLTIALPQQYATTSPPSHLLPPTPRPPANPIPPQRRAAGSFPAPLQVLGELLDSLGLCAFTDAHQSGSPSSRRHPDGVASRLETFRACRRPTAAATNQLPRPTSARQAPSHVPDNNAPLGRLRRCNLITLRLSAPQHCRGERLLGFERGDAHNRRTRPSTSKMPCLRPHGWWQQVQQRRRSSRHCHTNLPVTSLLREDRHVYRYRLRPGSSARHLLWTSETFLIPHPAIHPP